MLGLFRSELLSVSCNVLGISNKYRSLKKKKPWISTSAWWW